MKLLWILVFISAAYALGYDDGVRAGRKEVATHTAATTTNLLMVLEHCEGDLARATMAPPLPQTFGTWLALTQEFRAEVCQGLVKRRGPVPMFANLGGPAH